MRDARLPTFLLPFTQDLQMQLMFHFQRKGQTAVKLKVSMICNFICKLRTEMIYWFIIFNRICFQAYRSLVNSGYGVRDAKLIRLWTSYTPEYKDTVTVSEQHKISCFGNSSCLLLCWHCTSRKGDGLRSHMKMGKYLFSEFLQTRSYDSLMNNMISYLDAVIIEISVSGLCPH